MSFIWASLLILPIFLWIALAATFHGKAFDMDIGSGTAQYSFFGIFTLYRRLAYVIFSVGLTLAIASAHQAWPPSTVLLAAAAIYAFLFNLWVTLCYESYLHARHPHRRADGSILVGGTNYYGWKYALTLALATSSTLLFVSGLIIFLATLLER